MQFPKTFFVTGTDTQVGKTFVSALLTLGLGGIYWKPIQSGSPTDRSWVESTLGNAFFPETYHFKAPLSPHAAAALENTRIDISQIRMPHTEGPLIIEGVGGVLAPLNEKLFVVDLIQKFNCPALIVSKNCLGTINLTLMTIETLRRRGISLLGVILIGEENPMHKEAIESRGHISVIAQIPFLKTINKKTLKHTFNKHLGGT